MFDQLAKSLSDPAFLIALFVGIAVFATSYDPRAVIWRGQPQEPHEIGRARARRIARQAARRLAAESDRRRKGLREEESAACATSSSGST
jgi:tight adherence protein C